MTIPFDTFFNRVMRHTGICTQMELARALKVNRSAITQAKNRNAVPQKWLLALSRQYGISPDWLEFGMGQPALPTNTVSGKSGTILALPAIPVATAVSDTVFIPKVKATLCAGGGSFELEAIPVSEHPFPRAWLSRMGSPNAMVFMDVIGNSMEPGIRDGDMVLVDQSRNEFMSKYVFAVGHEEAIYIKRLERHGNGVTMLSDNPDYAPMEIAGDEMASFRIIGKVVWMCRDCRYA